MIKLEDFEKIDMRVGTIISASINKGARHKAYKLEIDFGKEIGIKKSSAQITEYYREEDLINKQVIAVINFEPIKISEVKSEVRILGVASPGGVILLSTDNHVENGKRVY